jgi:hypothetical protein
MTHASTPDVKTDLPCGGQVQRRIVPPRAKNFDRTFYSRGGFCVVATFHYVHDRPVEVGAQLAVKRFVRDVQPSEWFGVDHGISEPQDPYLAPLASLDLFEGDRNHAQHSTTGNPLNLLLKQVRAVGWDDQEIGPGS